MMLRYAVPLTAIGLLAFAIVHVVSSRKTWEQAPPPITPPTSPFANTIAGAGIIEAQTENISVGSPVAGIVVEVFVKVGQVVEPGDPLFRLDDRPLKAELATREAALRSAQAQFARLQNEPRKEEVPVRQAAVREAEADLVEKQDRLSRDRRLYQKQAITQEELTDSEQAVRMSQAALAQANAELELLTAGAWEFDKQVAQAAVATAEAQIGQVKTDLDRLVTRALVEGEVLQVNVRPGEFVAAPAADPLIVLGNTRPLHVRVDIDEHDIPRFEPGLPAVARVRGRASEEFPIRFVRVEPYVIPKRSLTGENTERVDTRVLQVIYVVDQSVPRLYVGQQLDVFIDISPNAAAKEEIASGE